MLIPKRYVNLTGAALLLIALGGFPFAVMFVDWRCEASISDQVGESHGDRAQPAAQPASKANNAPGSTNNEAEIKAPSGQSHQSNPHKKWNDDFYCKSTFTELTIAWCTFFLFLATGGLWYVTYMLARDAKATGEAQADKMDASVVEAGRAADAMERAASSISRSADVGLEAVATQKKFMVLQEDFAKRQMRAYLGIDIGKATAQNSATRFKFEARPNVINTGQTAAHDVRTRVKAAICPYPFPDDFVFNLPASKPEGTGATIHPHQSYWVLGVVDDLINDADIADVAVARGRGLYCWGVIDYKDIFGEAHYTEFCLLYRILPDGTVGHPMPKFNEAT